jgi:predicted transcriptional regulator
MKKLNKLLFELSSPERTRILLQLQKQPSKLSHVSRKLDLTVTESTRHLKRLSDAGLINKGSDGLFELTQYGQIALNLLSPLDFITKHRNYFFEYDLSPIPDEFLFRLGELANGKFGEDVFSNIEYTENEFRNAKKFIWIQTDQILKNLIPIVFEKIKQPFDFRFISPESVMPPDNKAPIPSTLPSVQKRVVPKVDVIVIVTEKAAGFCLPNKSGKIDYRNIHGTDPKFRKWCEDLFLYYWNQAKPVASR